MKKEQLVNIDPDLSAKTPDEGSPALQFIIIIIISAMVPLLVIKFAAFIWTHPSQTRCMH